MHNNTLELLILEELKKELKYLVEEPRGDVFAQGPAAQGQERKTTALGHELAGKLDRFQDEMQLMFNTVQGEIDNDAELNSLASNPGFPWAQSWRGIKDFILQLSEMSEAIRRTPPPPPMV